MKYSILGWISTFLIFLALAPSVSASGDSTAPRSATTGESGRQIEHCWSLDERFTPPDFASFFPDSIEGAAALGAFWRAADREAYADDVIIATVRDGLWRYDGDRASVLRWLGNRYVRKRGPQNPDAIELMYHAADPSSAALGVGDVFGLAIRFGLAVVDPKPPAVLRTLVAAAMASDDPDDLSRIAWGVGEQVDSALGYLGAYHRSDDATTRYKADVVARILTRDLKAFEWARENAYARAERTYRTKVPAMLACLRSGTSSERETWLTRLADDGGMAILDDHAIDAFAACARDPEPAVRRRVATLVGYRWVQSVSTPAPDAVDLLLDLSHDTDRETRHNAVYFGLSLIPQKEKAVIRRLVEMAMGDSDQELYQRIAWGLRGQRSDARELMQAYLAAPDTTTLSVARVVFEDLGGRELD